MDVRPIRIALAALAMVAGLVVFGPTAAGATATSEMDSTPTSEAAWSSAGVDDVVHQSRWPAPVAYVQRASSIAGDASVSTSTAEPADRAHRVPSIGGPATRGPPTD